MISFQRYNSTGTSLLNYKEKTNIRKCCASCQDSIQVRQNSAVASQRLYLLLLTTFQLLKQQQLAAWLSDLYGKEERREDILISLVLTVNTETQPQLVLKREAGEECKIKNYLLHQKPDWSVGWLAGAWVLTYFYVLVRELCSQCQGVLTTTRIVTAIAILQQQQ